MCGICGIFDRSGSPADNSLLDEMISIIRHRGPDGDGRFIDREVGLGHRRLSIIDVEGSRSPSRMRTGRCRLSSMARFTTSSNCEELASRPSFSRRARIPRLSSMPTSNGARLRQAVQWNVRFRHLGLRASANFSWRGITSESSRSTTSRSEVACCFASEIKALLADPKLPREVDHDALAELFTFPIRTLAKDPFQRD